MIECHKIVEYENYL